MGLRTTISLDPIRSLSGSRAPLDQLHDLDQTLKSPQPAPVLVSAGPASLPGTRECETQGVKDAVFLGKQLSCQHFSQAIHLGDRTDFVRCFFLNIVENERKIGLSIKELEERSEKAEMKNISDNQKSATSNLGELLKEEIEQKTERET